MDSLKIKNILNENNENIIAFIKKMDVFFFPKIEDQINLRAYVQKIKKDGCILGTYDSNKNINSLILFYCNNLDTKTAFISYLAVSPEYQSKNIAKRLVQEALSISKKNMMSKCQVTTNFENKKAINFYKKNNFKEYDCKFERNRNTVFFEIAL